MTPTEMLLHDLKNDRPAGLVDAYQDSGGVRVRQVENGTSWLFRVPPGPAPSGGGQQTRLHDELAARYRRAEARIRNARETAAAVRTNPAAPDWEDLVIERAEPRFPHGSVSVYIRPAWSSEQIAARHELLRRRDEKERLHRLAVGPPLRRVHVALDDGGRPDFQRVPDDLRDVVASAFPSRTEKAAPPRIIRRSAAVDPAPEPEPPEPDDE